METQKGSNSFRMHLARISVDGADQPIAREATLCLRTQQAETTVPNRHHLYQQLMDIYIDGDLMACWDLTLLKQHLSYHLVRSFSSFAPAKQINMTLPLPLHSPATPQNDEDGLKIIRIYFNKAQGFHTAISWLSKQAEMIHQDGRPATTLGFHPTSSAIREKSAGPANKPAMPLPAQPPASQLREKPPSRPQSHSGQLPIPQQTGYSQGQLLSLGGQAAVPQYLQRPRSQRQSRASVQSIAHGIPAQRRQSNLRRNIFKLDEADRSAVATPSLDAYRHAHHGPGDLQMPGGGDLPMRTMSAAPMGARLPPRYNRPVDATRYEFPHIALGTMPGRHSPQDRHIHTHDALSPHSSQESHVSSAQYLPRNEFEPNQDATIRLSRVKALENIATQSTIADDSMGVNVAGLRGSVLDDAPRRRRVVSMAPHYARIAGVSSNELNSNSRLKASSQPLRVRAISDTLPGPLVDGSGVPTPNLVTGSMTDCQDGADQNQGFGDALSPRGRDQGQEGQISHKRPPSTRALQQNREKRRKANQPIKRATRRGARDNVGGDQACTANNGTQTETVEPTLAALALDHEFSTNTVRAGRNPEMAGCGTQTELPPRPLADILHVSAILKLDSSLLLETKQWNTLEDIRNGLLGLGTQFVQGLYDVCKDT